MEFIKSKDICYLIIDTMKIIDKRLMEHGQQVAYLFYQMLKKRGGFEEFELAEYAFLGTLHDIGAYRTDNINKLLRFQVNDFMPHSIYGFLFLKYLSPMGERAKILLYHHINYSKVKDSDFEDKEIADFLHLADTAAIFYERLKDKFDCHIFEKYVGTRFSREAVELFIKMVDEDNVLSKIDDMSYLKELDVLMDCIMFTNEEKRQYLETLMYAYGFRSEQFVVDAVTTICIAEELGKKLGLKAHDLEILYYAALLHDIGMLGVPKSIIKEEQKLTREETITVRKHIETAENILKDRLSAEVFEVIVSHHERADGSGYPNHKKDAQMNQSDRILQLADMISALSNKRSYRKEMDKKEIVETIQEELRNKHFNKQIAQTFIDNSDEIWHSVRERAEEILATNTKINTKYRKINKNFTISSRKNDKN